MKKVVFTLAILAISVALFAFLKSQKPVSKKKAHKAVVKQFDVIEVQEETRSVDVTAYGRVQSTTRIQLKSEIQGQVLAESFRLRAGMNFTPGQIMFQVDPRQAKLNLEMTRAKLLTSLSDFIPEIRSQMPEAASKWESYFQAISDAKIPKLPEPSDNRENMLTHKMGISTLHYTLEQQALQVEKHIVRAPTYGTIVNSSITPGNIVSPGQLLGLFVSTSKYEMVVEIPLTLSEQLQVGKKVEVLLENEDQAIKARVARISKSVDPTTQNVPVVIEIPFAKSNPKILDSRFGTAIISSKKLTKVFALPTASVMGNSEVLVLQDSTLIRRKANIQVQTKDSVYVSTSNFQVGEKVVSELFQEFVPGMKAVERGASK